MKNTLFLRQKLNPIYKLITIFYRCDNYHTHTHTYIVCVCGMYILYTYYIYL